ncbi:MAG TPA: 16S rRNA (cytosine(1402)-N(4))-methyltransferase RsmH [Actinomycetota bacterium]|nr:16S rRNA (cytosine(1402)-N(4))-methyltransferase RsmH [Actinomycetota bacterium]
MEHRPVLADRVVELLLPSLRDGGVVVDATFGRGGHARALLHAAAHATLVGIDRDPDSVDAGLTDFAAFSERVRLVRDNFENLASVLERLGVETVRGVLFDLGVSSPQLDVAERGFSFRNDGPLDMRMDPTQPRSAKDVVNNYDERDLARVISRYGEERFARRIAKAIVRSRPVSGTKALAEIVKEAIPAATRRTGGHPARRTFQAIRIEVNGELDALERGLVDAIDHTEPGGRVVVICYHSLEDRIVKKLFSEEARGCTCPPDFPVCVCGNSERVRILTKRPLRPSLEEIKLNPRAEAAKLRAVERVAPEERRSA